MLNYYIVDAFTDRPFGGNTAGVVLLGDEAFPADELMQSVAAELRYSETAFVRRLAEDDYHLRYFTPCGEVELCGHATVATFALLHRLGMAHGACRCHTLAGDLDISLPGSSLETGEVSRSDGGVLMQMATPRIVRTLTAEETADAYRAVGLEGSPLCDCRSYSFRGQATHPPLQERDGVKQFPAIIAYAGLPDIMLHVPEEQLNALRPDMEAIAALTTRLSAISIHAYALCDRDGISACVRDFAPACGVPEESATGTANAALAHALREFGVVAPDATCRFLQGEAMGRPSVVVAQLSADGQVRIGGHATLVAQGTLMV